MSKSHFYGIIRPYRKDFITKPKKEEEEIMEKHFLYLKHLLNTKELVFAGPTLIEDDPFGVMIFETNTIEEARMLMENDPSIKQGIQEIADLRPIRLSLFRDIKY